MSDEIRVRDRKTGVVRTVTRKAYMAMGPKVYEKLGPAEEPQQLKSGQVHRSVSAPVIRPQIQDEPQGDSGNVTMTIDPPIQEKVKGKPGRKPKSISSDSTEDER